MGGFQSAAGAGVDGMLGMRVGVGVSSDELLGFTVGEAAGGELPDAGAGLENGLTPLTLGALRDSSEGELMALPHPQSCATPQLESSAALTKTRPVDAERDLMLS